MLKYIMRRILLLIPVLLAVTVLIFTILYFTPGDPVLTILGDEVTEETYAQVQAELGLDQPYIIQLGRYIWNVLHGDFGKSYMTGIPVANDLLSRFPTTLKLSLLSMFLSVLIAIPLGVLSATHQNRLLDTVARLVSLLWVSMPIFWLGLLLMMIFAVKLKWLPASGFYGPKYWVLPVLALGMEMTGGILRTTRSSMLEVIRQDYIRTARAKGAAENRVIWKHALKNAMIPVLTVIGIRFGNCLGGSVMTETVFSIPGLGKFMVDAIKQRDYPIVMGGVLLIALAFGIINLVVDIVYAFIDPRIKSQYSSKKKVKKLVQTAAGKEA
ncbi:MAG: ABC transporter permease [Lachnospiraceae bacterium]|nr:ABC transporter permease [Lachnospiraceae bacterium]